MHLLGVSVDEAKGLIAQSEVTLLDIRDAASFAAGNVCGSINVSNENVEMVLARADKDKPLVVCRYHGNSSKGAVDYFYGLGCKYSYSVDGDFKTWKFNP